MIVKRRQQVCISFFFNLARKRRASGKHLLRKTSKREDSQVCIPRRRESDYEHNYNHARRATGSRRASKRAKLLSLGCARLALFPIHKLIYKCMKYPSVAFSFKSYNMDKQQPRARDSRGVRVYFHLFIFSLIPPFLFSLSISLFVDARRDSFLPCSHRGACVRDSNVSSLYC